MARTRARLLAEEIEAQMKAKLWMAVQSGEVSPEQLADLLREVRRGAQFDEAFRDYIVRPMKEREASMLTSGLTGQRMLPGPMGGGGPQVPPMPNPADVLGTLGGGPQAPEAMSRLSIPLGPGSFAGSQVG